MRSLRSYLEMHADLVEGILGAHRTPGRVTGGSVGPRLIRFYIQPAPHVRFASIQRLSEDLALGLARAPGAPQSRDRRRHPGIRPPRSPSGDAGRRLARFMPLPIATALLGLNEHSTPLLARLPSPDVAHILISGTTGCGKSVLLRTIAASLLLGNTPEVVRLLLIDPKGRTFPPSFNAAHLVRPVITAPQAAVEALHSLVRLLTVRDQRGETLPHIVICIDELADLIMSGDGVSAPLERLIQRGREAGLHLIAATQRPSAAILSGIVRANFPLRIVGKVVSADDARIAAGRGGTGAERLQGRGDFLAVCGEQVTRFQAAYSTAQDLPGNGVLAPVPPLGLA
jgi:DNA segregation ATPase FtsK/SpoIIIE, S-DNA-T family